MTNSSQIVAIIIEVQGNDDYSHNKDGAQGSGIFAVSALFDWQGDDVYTGRRLGQGSAFLGTGMLWDVEGNDQYYMEDFGQAAAMWGNADR